VAPPSFHLSQVRPDAICAAAFDAEDFVREYRLRTHVPVSSDRDQLRRAMRRMRREIPARQRRIASHQLATVADRAHLLRPGSHIAVYHAYGAEADLTHLTHRAWRRGCQVFLPVITHPRTSHMEFFRYEPDMPLKLNAFGIPEPLPAPSARIAALHLDVIFLPLVAFDPRGWRLGSGAGFYDRCLQHLRAPRLWRRPKLIGVAYSQQRVERLEPNAWDVPLDAVVTQSYLQRFPTQRPGAAS